jgi:hypothetical protein
MLLYYVAQNCTLAIQKATTYIRYVIGCASTVQYVTEFKKTEERKGAFA